jgi:hypothetical protein
MMSPSDFLSVLRILIAPLDPSRQSTIHQSAISALPLPLRERDDSQKTLHAYFRERVIMSDEAGG